MSVQFPRQQPTPAASDEASQALDEFFQKISPLQGSLPPLVFEGVWVAIKRFKGTMGLPSGAQKVAALNDLHQVVAQVLHSAPEFVDAWGACAEHLEAGV